MICIFLSVPGFCIRGSEKAFGAQSLLFISLWKLTFFSGILSRTDGVSSSSGDQLEVAVLPWNAPPGLDKAASRVLAKLDCHYRTKPLYRSNVFLNIGQVLVMRASDRENFLENIFKRLASGPSGGSAGR